MPCRVCREGQRSVPAAVEFTHGCQGRWTIISVRARGPHHNLLPSPAPRLIPSVYHQHLQPCSARALSRCCFCCWPSSCCSVPSSARHLLRAPSYLPFQLRRPSPQLLPALLPTIFQIPQPISSVLPDITTALSSAAQRPVVPWTRSAGLTIRVR